jgi:multidrug efflux system membrane fusion protein
MQLSDEKNWRQGVVDFVNNRVDQNTATLQARAVFPNPGGRMLPGLFARVRVMGAMHPNAILVSDSAVTAEEDIYVALVVNAENKVEKRIVTRGALIGSLRIIEKGISKDDWVVINGRQKAQPKSVVDPIRATMADNPPEEKLLEAGAPATTASPATTPATTQSGGVP